MKIVIASSKDWFFKKTKLMNHKELDIELIKSKNKLNMSNLKKLNPKYIFFPHWNWKVSSDILINFECIAFHTAPLPYGRGGSPLQNLIIRGFREAPLCALKMTDEIDGGPIYMKKNISLEGSLEQIFSRISIVSQEMIFEICHNKVEPKKQEGEIYFFKRLSHKDNELNFDLSFEKIYDQIRMLDADEYPKAFVNLGNFKIEFTNASYDNDELKANVRFIKKESS